MMRSKLIKNEVIQLFKTTKETLRYYEQKGILSPEIGENNYRFYDFKDLQKLREIFLLKDLELSIDEMKQLNDKRMDEATYISLLKGRGKALQQKVIRLQEIQENIKQLVEILEKEPDHHSFTLRLQPERFYYAFDPMDEASMISPKAYFDRYQRIIENNFYSDKYLQMIYPYNALENNEFEDVQIAMELQNKKEIQTTTDQKNQLTLPDGYYLSIFYPFRHGKFDELPALLEEIETYLTDHSLNRISSLVIEKEHPELSLFLDEGTSIFELQIHVEKI